jgi:hypothetical protein
MLTAEGHSRSDVLAAMDSLIETGLEIQSGDYADDENLFTLAEIGVLRDQLNS